MAAQGRRRIDRILDPAYVADLPSIPLADLRSRRQECAEEEAALSYERRLLHGRLDILRDELTRRETGTEPQPIVERLKAVLGGEPRSSRGAFPQDVELPTFDNPRRRVEKLVSDDALARLPELSREEIESLIARIEEIEGEVSEQRRDVQRVLDELTGEVGRRYKTGEANPVEVLSED